MLDNLWKGSFFSSLETSIKRGKPLLLDRLWQTPKAFLLTAIQTFSHRNLIVIEAHTHKNHLYQDLLFFQKKAPLKLPSSEALPEEAPSKDITGKRLNVLYKLAQQTSPLTLLTPLQGFLQKTIPQKELFSLFTSLFLNQKLSLENLRALFFSFGYTKVPFVHEKGEFAIRGGIIDIFPISEKTPFRIELFGDSIDQIRTFDPNSQRSIEKVSSLSFSKTTEQSTEKKSLETLLDYLPNAIVVFEDLLSIEDQFVQLKQIFKQPSFDGLDLSSFLKGPFSKLYFSDPPVASLSPSLQKQDLSKSGSISLEIFGKTIPCQYLLHPFVPISSLFHQKNLLYSISQEKQLSFHWIFLFETDKEKQFFLKHLLPPPKKMTFMPGYLSSAMVIQDQKVIFFPYAELFQTHKAERLPSSPSYQTPPLDQIEQGDYVVHFHNGIGQYLGVEMLKNHLGHNQEFFVIEYAQKSRFLLPLSQSHLLFRYIGTKEGLPKVHKLGSFLWDKTKKKAEKAIIGYAKQLLDLEAKRSLQGGFSYPEDSPETKTFEASFPYTETEDQKKAIAEIKKDMTSPEAMDRLLCGDVGYGKTEVALRASFKAVVDGKKQVALLAPTTILALQHFETCKERMAPFSIQIGMISRLQSITENRTTLKKAEEGKIDILIGTHRITSKDVRFKNLGLIIIDEEQRFGVRTKEKLKAFKIGVDCLSLSATPIPRTLYLSLVGVKKLSTLYSPPQGRLPIKTILTEKRPSVIQNGILRELFRDGQVFFIHNRIESIYKTAKELEALVPTAKIGVVHGQMPSDQVDQMFHNFKSGKIQVLVATTLIESGLDIQNANTIFIDRADTFGIADLYQLRGRVGRWHQTAYAYLLIPKNRHLSDISQKRVSAILETSNLGGSLKLAIRDLEIRGSGNILGVQQSGHLSNIGFHLYCKLLKKTVHALKKEQPLSFFETEISHPFDANLPLSYMEERSARLEMYHRLGSATTYREIDDLLAELHDRFGPPPKAVFWLYHISRIRLFAAKKNISSIKISTDSLTIERPYSSKQSAPLKPYTSLPHFEKTVMDQIEQMLGSLF